MAYEHGSIKLDINNPFLTEGKLQSIAGLFIALYGLWLLTGVVDAVARSQLLGWGQLAIAGIALVIGLRQLGKGLIKVFRFYVGRGIPLSLSPDLTQSNDALRRVERHATQYQPEDIESMLLGRKNISFREPQGFVARLVHSLLPKLIFLPYIFRNHATRLSVALFNTAIALFSYALISFVTNAGLLANNAELIRTAAQWFILLYLIKVWWSAADLGNRAVGELEQGGAHSIAKPLILAVAVPLGLGQLLAASPRISELFNTVTASPAWQGFEGISPTGYLLLLVVLSLLASAWIGFLLLERMKQAEPVTEVSEYREVWQEDVHPREIFITLETIVLANRRYREIPNRIYKALDPHLKEQADGKGTFSGDILLETQPEPQRLEVSNGFRVARLGATTAGILMMLAGVIMLIHQSMSGLVLFQSMAAAKGQAGNIALISNYASQAASLFGNILLAVILIGNGRLLRNAAHWFWAELHFKSLLLNFKCDGTFRETRFVTGKGVYDSTQSDNQVIRSDITPWVTLCRAVSSTFAGIGNLNLEGPRMLLEMHRDEQELQSIINELLENLGSREKVASINNEKDLQAIDQINQVNRVAKQQLKSDQLLDGDDRKIIPSLDAYQND